MNHFAVIFAIIIFIMYPVTVICSFDYLKFAIHWPPAVCNQKQGICIKSKVFDDFYIHGLWPTNFSDPQPKYCPGLAFNLTKLSSGTKIDMTNTWKNLKKGKTDKTFWTHEWDKHGRCFTPDQALYFNLAIRLYKQYVSSLFQGLRNQGVIPHKNNPYLFQKIQANIESTLKGTTPEIACAPWNGKPNAQLWEIRICFSKDGKTIMNCPQIQSACKKNVYFLPSSTVQLME